MFADSRTPARSPRSVGQGRAKGSGLDDDAAHTETRSVGAEDRAELVDHVLTR